MPSWIELMRALKASGLCDLAVADSNFRVVSIDLMETGTCLVALPFNLAYPDLGVYLHEVSWECFGINGLN